jgi:hypothetical protein
MATASAALAQYAQSPGEANGGYESFTAVGSSEREALAEAMLNLAAPVYRATQLVA